MSVEVIAAGMTKDSKSGSCSSWQVCEFELWTFSAMSNIEYREDEGSEVSFKPTRCDLYQISLIPIPAQA